MRAFIDQLEKELQEVEELRGVTVSAFGWYSDEVPHPNECPAINIYPRSKNRERVYLIGADPEYDADPEVAMICWHQSPNGLKEAFERCEELAEKVQDLLAKINPRDTLGVHHFSTRVEEYVDYEYEETSMYGAIVVITARKSETHTD